MEKQIIPSELDTSQNVLYTDPTLPGIIEARYVKRESSPYFIVYLSSQTGCVQGCRMCHLTATKQTKLAQVTPEQFLTQAQDVLAIYDQCHEPVDLVHFNFMARGEALANHWIRNHSSAILHGLNELAAERNLESKFLISTIMPQEVGRLELADIFSDADVYPEIYYSLYSIDPAFRKKWLPRAIDADAALDKLAAWQSATGKTPKIHYAFIENENDSEESVTAVVSALKKHGLVPDINIVRYNSYSEIYGTESSEAVLVRNQRIFQELLPQATVKIIERVGFDVKASCGMFVTR